MAPLGLNGDEYVPPFLLRSRRKMSIRVFARLKPGCPFAVADKQVSFEAHSFEVDGTFGPKATQDEVYDKCVSSLVADVLQGYNAMLFAYGQSGSGKTYSMVGSSQQLGMIPRVAGELLSRDDCLVSMHLFEIYMERIYDLLGDEEGDPFKSTDVPRLYQYLHRSLVRTPAEFVKVFADAIERRRVSETKLNRESTRSHVITVFQVEHKTVIGRLFCVDLSGSENVKKSGAENEVLNESKAINLSLHHLSRVVKSCNEKHAHVSYRDSVLTHILKDAFRGNAKTTFLVTLREFADESLRTMRFGVQLRTIKNQPRINENLTAEQWRDKFHRAEHEIKLLKVENSILRDQLKAHSIPVPPLVGIRDGDSSVRSTASTIPLDVNPMTLPTVQLRMEPRPRFREELQQVREMLAEFNLKFKSLELP